jgi:hypothetical protein
MQYKHWWACYPTEPAYANAWPQILRDSLRIVTRAVAHGINVCGPNGYASPVIDQFDGIRIGGDAAHRRHEQPLVLPAAHRNPHPAPCGTRRPRPARSTPRATRTTAWSPRSCCAATSCWATSSPSAPTAEGGWTSEWAHGACAGHLPARTLVADLFGPMPETSPLIWPPQPIRIHPGRHHHA